MASKDRGRDRRRTGPCRRTRLSDDRLLIRPLAASGGDRRRPGCGLEKSFKIGRCQTGSGGEARPPRSGNAQPIGQLPSAAFPGVRTAGSRSTRPDRRALRRRPGRGHGPEEQAQPEAPEIQSEESTATIVRDEVPGPTPVRQVFEYKTALLSLKPKERDLASASRASLVRWAGLVVQVDGPMHASEAASRIYAAADVTRSSKRVQSSR